MKVIATFFNEFGESSREGAETSQDLPVIFTAYSFDDINIIIVRGFGLADLIEEQRILEINYLLIIKLWFLFNLDFLL